MSMNQILEHIDNPQQVKTLTDAQLETLAAELRTCIVNTVASNGGHLAPSLGAVELTLALYSVFNAEEDKIIWDVGHQAYAHKLLTGRRERFSTLRKKDGITGFPKRSESPYDAFGVGHASTSISAAVGMAFARDMEEKKHQVVAIIGDGALTGGEAFEALNHAGDLGKKLIVILNDNAMSIDKNVGAMSEYLSRIRVAPEYTRAKEEVKELIRSIPRIGDTVFQAASHLKDGMRSVLVPGSMFEELGFHYVGPIDGHNIPLLKEILTQAAAYPGPVLVHVNTKKGKGYLPAEVNPGKYHGIGAFDVVSGKPVAPTGQPPTYTSVFGRAITELGYNDPDIVAITAAMPGGTGLNEFRAAFPDRFIDVGIAEEHAVTMAAGIAAEGKKPVVALYSTFAQRAYDQLMHDVCLQSLHVTLCLDRAGLVGADGPTHHGVFDFSYLRHMPGMVVMAPKDERELRDMLYTAVNHNGPVSIRYPRGAGVGVPLLDDDGNEIPMDSVEIGKGEILKTGGKIALLTIGSMVSNGLKAADILSSQGLDVTVVNMRFVKPLDEKLISDLSSTMDGFVTIEENVLMGGFGSAVAEYLTDKYLKKPLLRLGIHDEFIEQGSINELWDVCGLTPEKIAESVKNFAESEID